MKWLLKIHRKVHIAASCVMVSWEAPLGGDGSRCKDTKSAMKKAWSREVFIGTLHSEIRKSPWREEGKTVEIRGVVEHQQNTIYTNHVSMRIGAHRNSSGKHRACVGLHQGLGVGIFVGLLIVGWVCLWLFCLLLRVFPLIGLPCPTLMQWLLPCLIVSCFILFGYHLLESCS